MYRKVLNFIKYHNAFTIIFVMVFSAFGASYAASPEVRDAVYSSKEEVISIDNTAVVGADLNSFNFNLSINSITEDGENYYVAYSYQTLVVEDGIWQNKEVAKTLKVSKEKLVGEDLGIYISEELGENINSERDYLKRVQQLEKGKGQSQKAVAVEYSGLIGKLFNPQRRVKVVSTPTPVVEIGNASEEASTSSDFTTGPSPTLTPEVTLEVTPTPEATPDVTPTPISELTPTPETTSTPEPTPVVATESPTPSPTPDITPTPSDTPTPTPSDTPTPTPEPTPTPDLTSTETPTP